MNDIAQQFLEDKVKKMRQYVMANSDQLTLGQLIEKVEAISRKGYRCHDGSEPAVRYDFGYFYPTNIDSWRGSYAELALDYIEDGGKLSLSGLLKMLTDADGKSFYGYKGGDFLMGKETPIWVANHGTSGSTAVVDVIDNNYEVILVTGHREF